MFKEQKYIIKKNEELKESMGLMSHYKNNINK